MCYRFANGLKTKIDVLFPEVSSVVCKTFTGIDEFQTSRAQSTTKLWYPPSALNLTRKLALGAHGQGHGFISRVPTPTLSTSPWKSQKHVSFSKETPLSISIKCCFMQRPAIFPCFWQVTNHKESPNLHCVCTILRKQRHFNNTQECCWHQSHWRGGWSSSPDDNAIDGRKSQSICEIHVCGTHVEKHPAHRAALAPFYSCVVECGLYKQRG